LTQEEITVVDGKDVVIGALVRSEMKKIEPICRVTYILIFNDINELLVQKRTMTKDLYPGLYDFAAGGVIMFNESYEESARRELKEELGIAAQMEEAGNVYFEDHSQGFLYRSWGRVFACCHDGPFILQPEEVESVEFMPLEKVLSLPPSCVTPDTRQVLISYLL